MGIGTSIFLLAVGAILRFAVTVTATGFNIHTIGNILMIVGALGILVSLLFWNSWGGIATNRRETVVVDDGPRARRRIVEEEVV